VLVILRILKRLSSLAIVLVAVAVVSATATAVVLPQLGTVLTAHHGTASELELSVLNQRSAMYASDGTLMTHLVDVENRELVPIERIPQPVIAAVLAVEDTDFYRHNGVNPRGTLRALFENVSAGSIEQGGSTITMQVVRSALLSNAQTLDRKITEAFYAVRLEQQMTKDQILERYLNTVYLGGNAYGVQAAAEQYWGVGVEELGWEEAALIAGLIRSPVNYDPTRFPERARDRRLTVVDRLQKVGLIDDEQAERIRSAALPAERNEVGDTRPRDYFARVVLEELLHREDILGPDPAQRRSLVYNGGLRIYTTFDPRAQDMAERARDELLPDDPREFTVALVALDTHTGAVRAMIGGPGFDRFQFNIATQGLRQPGSSMKTFVLAALVEQGYSPNDTVRGDSPCSFDNPGGSPDPYEVGGPGTGLRSIAHHTVVSGNCAFVRLGQIAGLDRVVEVANRMGLTSPLHPRLSLPLGTSEVLPIDMAAAYATIGNDGIRNRPWFIERVEDRAGNVIYEHHPMPERAMSVQTARLMTQVLEQAVTNGTGRAARLQGGHRAAGKTGTTQNYHDAWFVGFTPYLTTAVWMGNAEEKVPMRNVAGWGHMFGGRVPATMWGQFMNEYHAGLEPLPFFPPEPVRGSRYLRTPGEIDSCDNPGQAADYTGPTVLVDSDRDGEHDCFRPATTTTQAPPPGEPPPPESPAPTAPPTAAPPPTPPATAPPTTVAPAADG
jgi:penicillin-binding protein 1A